MRRLAGLFLGFLTVLFAVQAGRAQDFDYYVLSLSWSSSWCQTTGDARDDPQCEAGRGLTFILHGLWPQYEEGGWPEGCRSRHPDATRAETGAMVDLMQSSGLAWHEWKTHGRCSDLSARAYFAASRQAFQAVTLPPLFARVTRPLEVAPSALHAAFVEANPDWPEGGIVLSCGQGLLREVRMCLTRDLEPRECGPDVGTCPMRRVSLPPLR